MSELNIAGEMFLYLNSCPGALKPWFIFYRNIFQKLPLDEIILTLNRIIKGSNVLSHRSSQSVKNIAKKVFEKTASLNHLKGRQLETYSI